MLIVEDDPDLRELLARSLREEGYRVARAYDGPEAMQLVERERFPSRPDPRRFQSAERHERARSHRRSCRKNCIGSFRRSS